MLWRDEGAVWNLLMFSVETVILSTVWKRKNVMLRSSKPRVTIETLGEA